MFELADGYRERGMAAYSDLQEREFAAQKNGFTAVRHQHEVGTSYFDAVAMAVSSGQSSTVAMSGSTESEQFAQDGKAAREPERAASA
jgi:isocitrate lyase